MKAWYTGNDRWMQRRWSLSWDVCEKKLLGRRMWCLIGCRAKQGWLARIPGYSSSRDEVKDDATSWGRDSPTGIVAVKNICETFRERCLAGNGTYGQSRRVRSCYYRGCGQSLDGWHRSWRLYRRQSETPRNINFDAWWRKSYQWTRQRQKEKSQEDALSWSAREWGTSGRPVVTLSNGAEQP